MLNRYFSSPVKTQGCGDTAVSKTEVPLVKTVVAKNLANVNFPIRIRKKDVVTDAISQINFGM